MSDPNGWVPIGPSVVPNSDETPSPGIVPAVSGRCTCIALDPTNPATIIYAGAAGGGIWKSVDGGLNWTPKSDFEAGLSIGCIAIDPSNPSRVYAGTGEPNFVSGQVSSPDGGFGVLVSDNGGDSWILRGADQFAGKRDATGFLLDPPKRIGQIFIDPSSPANNRHLFAGTDEGLFESTDSGDTWNPLAILNLFRPWISSLHFDPASQRLVVATATGGVFRRVGTGAFQLLSNNLPPKGFDRIAIAVAPTNPDIIYAAFGTSGALLGVWRSTNGGDRWEPFAVAPAGSRQTSFNLVLKVDPANPDRVFLGEIELSRAVHSPAANGKQVWNRCVGLHVDQHALVFDPNDSKRIWAGNDGGIYLSTDGGDTWAHRNRGFQTLQFYSVAVHPARESLALAGAQDNGMQRYTGHPAWQHVRGGDGIYAAIDPVNPRIWYGGGQFFHGLAITRSDDTGSPNSFKNIADKEWLKDLNAFNVPFVHSPAETGIVYLGTKKLYRRIVSTGAWETVKLENEQAFTADFEFQNKMHPGEISAIAVSRSHPTIVYVGSLQGHIFRLERTGDGTWRMFKAPKPFKALQFVSDIAVHPNDPDKVYFSVGDYDPPVPVPEGRIFFSDDGGKNWIARGQNQPQLDIPANGITIKHELNSVYAIALDPDHPTHVFIGCTAGVFRSTDEGVSWTRFSENLPNAVVYDLQIHSASRVIRVATFGRSAWERRLDLPATPAPTIDLYLRDNVIDVGRRDTPVTVSDPFRDSGNLDWHSSPDIKVDGSKQKPISTTNYANNGVIDYIGFEKLRHENPRKGQDTKVYVQVHNRGPDTATNVKVRVYFSHKLNGNYPNLPADFWTTFPDSETSHPIFWKPIGPAIEIAQIRPADPAVVSWDWTVPDNAQSKSALLAVVTNSADPVNENQFAVEDVARTNKRVAVRELDIGTATSTILTVFLIATGAVILAGIIYTEATD